MRFGDMMNNEAYQMFMYCPMDGKKLVMGVDFTNQEVMVCPDHPGTLYPSANVYGEQVMVFDPHQSARMGFRTLVEEPAGPVVLTQKAPYAVNEHALIAIGMNEGWRCKKCKHVFNYYRDARDFECGESCSKYHSAGLRHDN
jgi:hypothetical protein